MTHRITPLRTPKIAAFVAVLGCTLALTTTSVARAETCDCERFQDMVGVSSLANEVGDIGLDALHPEGRTFSLQGKLNEALRLKINASELIPERCKKVLLGKIHGPRLDLVAHAGYSLNNTTPTPFTFDSRAAADSYLSAYNQMAAAYGCIPPKNADPVLTLNYQSCIKQNGTSALNQYSQYISSSSDQSLINAAPGTYSTNDIHIIKAYNSLLNSTSEKALLGKIASKKDGLGTRDFLTVVQMFGSRLNSDYDNARDVEGSPASQGIVSVDKLLAAAKQNTIALTDPNWNSRAAQDAKVYSGVCRDIATLQAEMLNARGFKNTYALSYQQNDGYHVTVIAQDPTIPRQIYLVDYDALRDRKDIDGPSSLLQDTSDLSMSYFLYHPGGSQAADIASEFQKFASEAAGFDVKNLDPLGRTTNDLVASNVTYGNHRRGSARVFAGQDVTGAQYLGAASDYEYSQSENAPGKIGIVTMIQKRPGSVYNSSASQFLAAPDQFTGKDDHAFALYLQIEQHAKTKPLRLAKGLHLTLDSRLSAAGALTAMIDGTNQGSVSVAGDARLNLETKLDEETKNFHGTLRAGVEFVPGFSDVRASSTASAFRPAFNKSYFDATGILRFKDASLIADALVVVDQLGVRGRATAGVATDHVAVTANISGRLTNDTALYEDSSIRRVGLDLNVRPSKHVNLSLTGEMPIEGDNPLGSLRIFGNVGATF